MQAQMFALLTNTDGISVVSEHVFPNRFMHIAGLKGNQSGKLVSRRIKTLATTPEDIGFTGCWRLIAVERSTIDLTLPRSQQPLKPKSPTV